MFLIVFRFHFPHGNPSTLNPYGDGKLEKFTEEFRRHKNASVNVDQLGDILKVRTTMGLFLLLKRAIKKGQT